MEFDKSKSFSFQNKSIKIFFNRNIKKRIFSCLPDNDKETLKACFNLYNWKDKKKLFKKEVQKYVKISDSDKLTYRINDDGTVTLFTSIFNLRPEFTQQFNTVFHKETGDVLKIKGDDLEKYIKLLKGNAIHMSDGDNYMKLAKCLITFDKVEKEEDVYRHFYEQSGTNIDFSNKDEILKKQKENLEKISKSTTITTLPLQYISETSNWSVILCQGGSFAYGFFKGTENVEHKSDSKYVTRKKAGQRQVLKDKAKTIKSSRLNLTSRR